MRHFKHCYAYAGAYCSCDAELIGGYKGSHAGPELELPPTPFALHYRPVATDIQPDTNDPDYDHDAYTI